jgi:hypothetical protein
LSLVFGSFPFRTISVWDGGEYRKHFVRYALVFVLAEADTANELVAVFVLQPAGFFDL